jgi:hypothetical protein
MSMRHATQHSVHGKACNAFGRELDVITQDAPRFYNSHAVYTGFGAAVLDREKGKKIAKALGMAKLLSYRIMACLL